jgi:hypothetical protein
MTNRQLARLHEHLTKLKLVTIQAPLEILLSGWSCDSGPGRKAGGVPAPPFSPRLDGRGGPYRLCILKWPSGCATKLSSGG